MKNLKTLKLLNRNFLLSIVKNEDGFKYTITENNKYVFHIFSNPKKISIDTIKKELTHYLKITKK